jgi:ABC-type glycerol-3-phosphate transport system permease component
MLLAVYGVGTSELLFLLLIVPVVIAYVVAFCKICAKAGFPALLGLLMLIPVANVLLPIFLGFAEWPARTSRPPADLQ